MRAAKLAALRTMAAWTLALRLCMPWFISWAFSWNEAGVQAPHMLPIKKRT